MKASIVQAFYAAESFQLLCTLLNYFSVFNQIDWYILYTLVPLCITLKCTREFSEKA